MLTRETVKVLYLKGLISTAKYRQYMSEVR